MIQKPLVLKDGKIHQLPIGDTLEGSSDNFSFKKVKTSEFVTIPDDQQMLLSGDFTNLGQLNNFGEMILIDIEDSDTPAPEFPELPDDNFSYSDIKLGEIKTIPDGQQMITMGDLAVFGQLNNFGELKLYEYLTPDGMVMPEIPGDNFSYKEIAANETKTIPSRQQMNIVGGFKNLGTIVVNGCMTLLSAKVDESDDEYLPPYIIEDGEVFTIKRNRLMYIPRLFSNNGILINNGLFILGGL